MNNLLPRLAEHDHEAAGNGLLRKSLCHAHLHMDLPLSKLIEIAAVGPQA